MRFVVAIALSCVACGRLDFDLEVRSCLVDLDCDDGDPCTDDRCSAQACAHAANTAPCEDGDACTIGDRCVLGVCGAGAATACAGAMTSIYRSVGVGSGTAIVAGAGMLAIVGTTAAFDTPLADTIGVGDVIEYDSDGDGSRDALAFIHRRLSAQVYLVRTSLGATPIASATPNATWSVFRAYRSLADAVDYNGSTPNPNITAATFDGYGAGRDLVANNEQWSFACYDDDLDTAAVGICSTSYTRSCSAGWTTDASHVMRIYTPTGPSEVGVSQRHLGTWGSGYRRTAGIIMWEGFVHLDGISMKRSTVGNGRGYYSETQGGGGETWISNSFGWSTLPGEEKVYDSWDTGVPALGPTYTQLRYWNDIALNETPDDPASGFYINSNRADAVVDNCTAYVVGGGAFYQSNNSLATLTNCIGYSENNAAFRADDQFEEVSSSVANDGSLTGISNGAANASNQTISFADRGGGDFHLDPSPLLNLAIRGHGQDLSNDVQIPFTTDIDGDPRPPGAWDIGADQAAP